MTSTVVPFLLSRKKFSCCGITLSYLPRLVYLSDIAGTDQSPSPTSLRNPQDLRTGVANEVFVGMVEALMEHPWWSLNVEEDYEPTDLPAIHSGDGHGFLW